MYMTENNDLNIQNEELKNNQTKNEYTMKTEEGIENQNSKPEAEENEDQSDQLVYQNTSKFVSSPTITTSNEESNVGFFGFLSSLVRTAGIIIIILLIISSGVLVYIFAYPESRASQWLVDNTVLEEFLSIEDDEDNLRVSIRQDPDTPLASFINPENISEFTFAPESNAKPITEVVQEVLPSVISLSIALDPDNINSPTVSGTGFIVDETGLVITNKHVIANKCSDRGNTLTISGVSHTQEVYELDLLSVDPVDDIAILKIRGEENNFKPVEFADTDTIPLGAEVIAIGNVLGQLKNSVTRGVVSGLNRTVEFGSRLVDECTNTRVAYTDSLVQTDAAINRGNSGGPLFDSFGRLVGMNTLGTVETQNIGFAIPSNLIVSDLNSFRRFGKITRARLGVFSRPITSLEKRQNDWLPAEYGEILLDPLGGQSAITPDSPADRAGLGVGDIIIESDGKRLLVTDQNPSPLRREILSKQPGDEIELIVIKANGGNATDGYTYDTELRQIKVELAPLDFDLVS